MFIRKSAVKPLAGQKRLPLAIRDWQDIARGIPDRNLPRQVKHTFAALVSFLDQDNPHGTVFARKSKVAERAQVSERTIYRHLSMLKAYGYIEHLEQEQSDITGRFKVSHIRMTKKTLDIFGVDPADSENLSTPQAVLADATIKGLSNPSSSSNKQPLSAKVALPQDLTFLAERMHVWGIFSLMKKAKQKGKLLSDIAAVAQHRIVALDLRDRRLYAYLLALIVSAWCFVYPARQAKANEQYQIQRGVMQMDFERWKLQWDGKTYRADTGYTVSFEMLGTTAMVTDANGMHSAIVMNSYEDANVFIVGILKGLLKEVPKQRGMNSREAVKEMRSFLERTYPKQPTKGQP